MSDTSSYRRLDVASLPAWLATIPGMADRLGPPPGWRAREVSDGNMNAVYVVEGPAGTVCVKQALPHVRENADWKLPLDRADYEVAWMRRTEPHAGGRLPALIHYDPAQYVIVMENLTPHIILRQGLIDGRRFDRAAADVGRYVADTAFATSDLALPFERKFANMAIFARNEQILRITVDLILTDPYHDSPRNRWTRPHLDAAAAAIRADATLKVEAGAARSRFLTNTQALIHGDLHSGSVMVTDTDTRVIDGEFALYGPIGFDLGAFVGNLLLAWFAQPGHEARPGERAPYCDWILRQIPLFWRAFHDRFLELWASRPTGDAYPAALFADAAGQDALAAERRRFVAKVFQDLVGYAGMKMIRRLLSYAHVADFESIADPARRAACEAPALRFARDLVVQRAAISSPQALIARAEGASPAARAAMSAADAVLLDIEGTLSSAAYVARVLWRHSREHMAEFVAQHGHEPQVARALAETAAISGDIDDPAATLVRWIDEDRKLRPLKEIQGLLWADGFASGAFSGHIFPDALLALRRWHAAGLPLYVFSSGSVRTQRDFFAHLPEGDITPLFRGHFDTAIGAKTDVESYRRIAVAIGHPAARTLFLSDNPHELNAAMDAGLVVRQVVREATVPDDRFAPITSFDQVALG